MFRSSLKTEAKWTLLLSAALFCTPLSVLFAQQNQFKISNPLEVHPTLSGNFGELRPNHFHSGIDLKTAAREGLNVLAAADGYVSRIKISPYGYGKVIYIDHPEGYTTVYGHLQLLNDSIARYVRRIQYEQQSFELEVFPGQNDLPVKRGDVVAFSGNTGGSGGPHLHFEVRESKTEVPRNPLNFGFPLTDTKSPVLQSIGIAPLQSNSTVDHQSTTGHYRIDAQRSIASSQPVKVKGAFGIEISGYDQQDGSSNQNGIYFIQGFIDDVEFARFTADSIPFDQSRFLNALIDYEYYYQNKSRFIRLYRLPGNALENVTFLNRGSLSPSNGIHEIKVVCRDFSGNESVVKFKIDYEEQSPPPLAKEEYIKWNVHYYYESENIQLFVPSGTLYKDEILKIKEGENRVQFMRPQIPVQTAFVIKMKAIDSKNGELIGQVNDVGVPFRVLQTKRNGQWLEAESKSFGSFAVVYDQTPPQIKSVNFVSGRSITQRQISFEIKDNLSGISSYKVSVDGKWILAEYEPKLNKLFFDSSELPSSTEKQELNIVITDMAGNVATFEGSFYKP